MQIQSTILGGGGGMFLTNNFILFLTENVWDFFQHTRHVFCSSWTFPAIHLDVCLNQCWKFIALNAYIWTIWECLNFLKASVSNILHSYYLDFVLYYNIICTCISSVLIPNQAFPSVIKIPSKICSRIVHHWFHLALSEWWPSKICLLSVDECNCMFV